MIDECRLAVRAWRDYWLGRGMELVEQDESGGDEDALLRSPPFQLGRFPALLARIKGHLRAALEADGAEILAAVEPLVEGFFALTSPFVKGGAGTAEGLESLRQTWQHAATLQVDQDALRPLLVDKIVFVFSRFTSRIATANSVSGMVEMAAHEGSFEDWVESCGEERSAILGRIHRVEKARRGIVQALDLSDLEVQVLL